MAVTLLGLSGMLIIQRSGCNWFCVHFLVFTQFCAVSCIFMIGGK